MTEPRLKILDELVEAEALVFALNSARLVLPLALGRQGTALAAEATA